MKKIILVLALFLMMLPFALSDMVVYNQTFKTAGDSVNWTTGGTPCNFNTLDGKFNCGSGQLSHFNHTGPLGSPTPPINNISQNTNTMRLEWHGIMNCVSGSYPRYLDLCNQRGCTGGAGETANFAFNGQISGAGLYVVQGNNGGATTIWLGNGANSSLTIILNNDTTIDVYANDTLKADNFAPTTDATKPWGNITEFTVEATSTGCFNFSTFTMCNGTSPCTAFVPPEPPVPDTSPPNITYYNLTANGCESWNTDKNIACNTSLAKPTIQFNTSETLQGKGRWTIYAR